MSLLPDEQSATVWFLEKYLIPPQDLYQLQKKHAIAPALVPLM